MQVSLGLVRCEQQHPELHEKGKESWVGEKCSEIKGNLRKNNSKKAHQLLKDLTTVKQGKLLLSQII